MSLRVVSSLKLTKLKEKHFTHFKPTSLLKMVISRNSICCKRPNPAEKIAKLEELMCKRSYGKVRDVKLTSLIIANKTNSSPLESML